MISTIRESQPSGPPGALPATEATRACQHAALRWLPMTDQQSFDDARRGFIADLPTGAITRANGTPVWNLAAYGFPPTSSRPTQCTPACGAMRG